MKDRHGCEVQVFRGEYGWFVGSRVPGYIEPIHHTMSFRTQQDAENALSDIIHLLSIPATPEQKELWAKEVESVRELLRTDCMNNNLAQRVETLRWFIRGFKI